jgi:hypothetical protein
MTYIARLNNNRVYEVLVGTEQWASESLEGAWVMSDTKVGIGWLWDGEVLAPPVVEDVEGS